MSHVDFKKWPCHPVEFKGRGPLHMSALYALLVKVGDALSPW